MNEAIRSTRQKDQHQLQRWASDGRLYAFIDPFFEIPMPVEMKELELRDTDPVFYEVIAWDQVTYEPARLVRVTSEVLEWIQNSLSTERWGLFIASDAGLETLAGHYQKFVIAKGPDLNPYFLRFHDASVLEVLLGTWEAKERAVFLGPALAFGLPDLDTMEVRLLINPYSPRAAGSLPLPEDCLLNLRESQLKACSEAIDRDLVKVIYWHLRNHHAKSVQFVDKRVLESRVQFSIRKARGYGLGTVADLAGFTALMFELAPNFDDHPSFRGVLNDPNLAPEAKMKRLSQVISDQEWHEAGRLYDREFWTKVAKAKTRKR